MLTIQTLKQSYFEDRDPRIKLLSEINDYSIYSSFIGREIKYGEFIQSPLRTDNRPSFNIYLARDPKWDGQILFKDYSGPSGNVFQFVSNWAMYHENVYIYTADEVVNYIRIKLNLAEGVTSRVAAPIVTESKFYNVSLYEWYTKKHVEFLSDLGINLDLAHNTYLVRACEFLMNEHQQVLQNFRGTVTFAYVIFDKFKLYQPYEENFLKFFNHCPANYMQGYQQCKGAGQDTLIITKAMKDILVVQSHTKRWYDIVAPHGEGYNMSNEWVAWYLTYPRIVLMYDPDLAGIAGMNKLKRALKSHPNYNGQKIDVRFMWKGSRIKRHGKMVVPVKDPSDFRLIFGGEATEDRLHEILL